MVKKFFLLGGPDAEMVWIRKRLTENGQAFSDRCSYWGVKASEYLPEILLALENNWKIVLVEVINDIIDDVNHHDERSGEPASILQVLSHLEQEPTRWDILIAKNDEEYIPGLIAAGATEAEIATIRLLDREAQGVTAEHEQEAERAITAANAYELARRGELVVLTMNHSKVSPASDRLFLSWKDGKEILLILSSDGEANFFGDGLLCKQLRKRFGGWSGKPGFGKKGEQAFWGSDDASQEDVRMVIEKFYKKEKK